MTKAEKLIFLIFINFPFYTVTLTIPNFTLTIPQTRQTLDFGVKTKKLEFKNF